MAIFRTIISFQLDQVPNDTKSSAILVRIVFLESFATRRGSLVFSLSWLDEATGACKSSPIAAPSLHGLLWMKHDSCC